MSEPDLNLVFALDVLIAGRSLAGAARRPGLNEPVTLSRGFRPRF